MQNKVDHFNRILASNVKGAIGIVTRAAQNNDPAIVQVQLNNAPTPYEVICHRSYITITQQGLPHPEIWAGKDYGSAAQRIAKLLNNRKAA